ncbi:diguanylate cyclase (GGDEF)-like protein/PAS domain S-box-containing protein [Paenibacillus phyllosphaerae]|uniref:Diguanylate cyclase (GGDEF)-like protein/PAS domain S-box-containing protein n=1 Tax=Paenibacillus phyllosphaerae TaxID=274593 RepID=A0A7W5FKY7_9BACL|nr:EAL domain-containing protein [Paenibacillus phyllosphaerae]MBB3108611.1 diguanylate cyclase (GGDEF)-like protein/PAS domain S-box-containing protein [Paenibacillus phyllosphaerae]
MGLSIWALQFIGTLVYRPAHMTVAYNMPLVLLSVVIAVIVMIGAIWTGSRAHVKPFQLLGSGLVAGVAVCGIHIIGIEAMQPVQLQYNPLLITLGSSLTIGLCMAIQLLAYRFRTRVTALYKVLKLGTCIIVGGLVVAIHYVFTSGIRVRQTDMQQVAQAAEHPSFWVAIGVAGWSVLVLGIMMICAYVSDQRAVEQDALNGSLLESASDGIVMIDSKGVIIEFNPVAAQTFGYRRHEAIGRRMSELLFSSGLCGDYAEEIERFMKQPSESVFDSRLETTGMRADGTFFPMEITVTRIGKTGPSVAAAFIRDITERKRVDAALRESEERYRKLIHYSPDPILVHLNGIILFVNNAAAQTLGAGDPEELTGRFLIEFMHPEDREFADMILHSATHRLAELDPLEIRCYKMTGELIDLEVKSILVKWNGKGVVQTIARDVTVKKQAAEMMRRMAYYDQLTGLANRNLFLEQASAHLAKVKGKIHHAAVLFIDLDRFKMINDTLGHHIGDGLLREFSWMLQTCLRKEDIVSRIAGDEFLVMLPDTTKEEAEQIAKSMILQASSPFLIDGHNLIVTPSIGVALYPEDGEDVDRLMKNADAAMYRTKELGKNSYSFYEPNLRTATSREMQLEQSLHRALEQDEFILHYQPRFDLKTGAIAGVEALIRWDSAEHGLVSPQEFIPLAEETGMIVPIGERILRKACEQAKRWIDAGKPPIRMAVNLSLLQFKQVHLVEQIASILEETGLPGRYLELEITESVASQNEKAVAERLREIKELGITVSIDDFGTGYSSLSYLRQYPLDVLKIDRSFIRNLVQSPDDTAIVKAIIAMAHSLHLSVCAEGVETEEQLVFLRDHGCGEVQGFLLAKPKPAEEVEHILARTITYPVHAAS